MIYQEEHVFDNENNFESNKCNGVQEIQKKDRTFEGGEAVGCLWN